MAHCATALIKFSRDGDRIKFMHFSIRFMVPSQVLQNINDSVVIERMAHLSHLSCCRYQ